MVKYISKELAKKLIDNASGDTIMVLTYDKNIGISDCGELIKKAKGKKLVNSAEILVLNDSLYLSTIMLHNMKAMQLDENIVKSILLSKL